MYMCKVHTIFYSDHLHLFYAIMFSFYSFHMLKLKRIDRLKHFYSMLLNPTNSVDTTYTDYFIQTRTENSERFRRWTWQQSTAQTDTCTSLMNNLKVTHTERSRSTYTYHIKRFQEFAHLALIVHDLLGYGWPTLTRRFQSVTMWKHIQVWSYTNTDCKQMLTGRLSWWWPQ